MNTLICPMSHCRTENDPFADICTNCGIPLNGYVNVTTHSAKLFNAGLEAARHGNISQARDMFTAVVHWYPNDIEAHNALAMACLALKDVEEAYHQWELVLEQAPANPLAQQSEAELRHLLKRRRLVKKRHHPYSSFSKNTFLNIIYYISYLFYLNKKDLE